MSDWASWKDGTKTYGNVQDAFLTHAGADQAMDADEFAVFMKTLGIKDGSFKAVAQASDSTDPNNQKISLSELVAQLNKADKANGGDTDGKLERSELDSAFKEGALDDKGGTGTLRFEDVDKNKAEDGLANMEISKEELNAFVMKYDDGDGKLNSNEISSLAKATGADADLLASYAGEDGYLDAKDLEAAFSKVDLSNGMSSKAGDLFAKFSNGDNKLNSNEMAELAKAAGLKVDDLAKGAGEDGYMTLDELKTAMSGVGDDDGKLNADELYSFFGVTPPDGDGGPNAKDGFNFKSADTNGDGTVTSGETYGLMKALSDPGADGVWHGDEVKALATAMKVSEDTLSKIANADENGKDGYLEESDLAAVLGSGVNESTFNSTFGLTGTGTDTGTGKDGGTGTDSGGSTGTATGLSFTDVNQDAEGILSMFASTGEIFDYMLATKTDGGDSVWNSADEMKALAGALKVDVAALNAVAGTDGTLDANDIGALVASIDGAGTDNQLNADQLKDLFKASKA